MIAQLPLSIRTQGDTTFTSFIPGRNTQAINNIHWLSQGIGEQFIYIWGVSGVGRTHILQAACHSASKLSQTALYIPLVKKDEFSISLFQGLENLSLICLDDLEQIVGDKGWEENLFHLFNRLRAAGGRLLISANSAPKQLAIKLPDLKSRLSSGVVFHLHALTDEQKKDAIVSHAHSRGLELDQTVAQFLLSRCSRNTLKLFQTLEQLDQASLAAQRRLTIPFVKQVLGV
jgi:DnaA-homolog protein